MQNIKYKPWTEEAWSHAKQQPNWRNFYMFGPGKRDFSFSYIGPAVEKEVEIDTSTDHQYNSIRG